MSLFSCKVERSEDVVGGRVGAEAATEVTRILTAVQAEASPLPSSPCTPRSAGSSSLVCCIVCTLGYVPPYVHALLLQLLQLLLHHFDVAVLDLQNQFLHGVSETFFVRGSAGGGFGGVEESEAREVVHAALRQGFGLGVSEDYNVEQTARRPQLRLLWQSLKHHVVVVQLALQSHADYGNAVGKRIGQG